MALITVENAREMSAKGNEAKRQAAILRANGEPPKPLLPEEKFILLTKSRTRGTMERIWDRLREETDPAAIDRLSAALTKLAELERQLSGRPLPGTLRPSQKQSKRSAPSPEPISPVEETPAQDNPLG